MGPQIKTPLDAALIVANALHTYRNQHPLLQQQIEEIQSTGSVTRLRLKLGTGETFVIDITREPKPRSNHDTFFRASSNLPTGRAAVVSVHRDAEKGSSRKPGFRN